MLRRRYKRTEPLEQRLANDAKRLREQARLLPPGSVRDAALRKARQAENDSRINDWRDSSELQSPE